MSKVRVRVEVFDDGKIQLHNEKGGAQNFYKTKKLGINAINKSYFIIFFVEHMCRKLRPRL